MSCPAVASGFTCRQRCRSMTVKTPSSSAQSGGSSIIPATTTVRTARTTKLTRTVSVKALQSKGTAPVRESGRRSARFWPKLERHWLSSKLAPQSTPLASRAQSDERACAEEPAACVSFNPPDCQHSPTAPQICEKAPMRLTRILTPPHFFHRIGMYFDCDGSRESWAATRAHLKSLNHCLWIQK